MCIAILLVAFAVSAIGAPSALAAPREIAYGCNGDICLLDPDNPGDSINLTNNGLTSIEEAPVWSPDGTYLAFVSNLYKNTRNVYVMNPTPGPGVDVTVARQVTHYPDGQFLGDPVWSPDGSRIAFVRQAPAPSVLVAASDGTTATPVTIAKNGNFPSWAPDGGKIAYSESQQVFLKNADGSGEAAPLPNGGGIEPAWSPDGSRIAFGAINPVQKDPFLDLHVAGVSGAGTPVIRPSNFTQWIWASWSPDGSRIAYRSTNENAGFIRVVNADGSGDHPLASSSTLDAHSMASWSPDGSRVVFYGQWPPTSTEGIYIANTDGSGTVQPLATGPFIREPVWKPVPRFRVIQSSNGSAAPIPKTIPAKFFWIRTGIPWKPTQVQIVVGAVFCADITCGVNSRGTMKGSAPILPPRAQRAAASGKKKKPKAIVVAQGKMKVPAGKKKPLKLTLTKQGIAVLKQRGSLKISLTVTVTAPGYKKRVDHHTVKVVREAPKKHKRAGR
jgi:Tol biopolymer transport system component